MRIAISNIAWDIAEDEGVASLLGRHGVDAIDIAPGKYFPVPADATEEDFRRVRSFWADRGIAMTGMQALLFGTTGLNLFGEAGAREAMLRHLAAVCRIGGGVGATRLVFGSPKNRDRSGLSDEETRDVAVAFFRRLGDAASSHGVQVCLEPNPPVYGANFMTTSAETAAVVEAVGHPAIRMQLDTGALAINGESPAEVIRSFERHIGHVHASEPNLVPLGDGDARHAEIGELLRETLPEKVVTIEMVATKEEPHLQAIERALRVAIRYYGDGSTNAREALP
jgi:sugar phosphate isomerase/epimerase